MFLDGTCCQRPDQGVQAVVELNALLPSRIRYGGFAITDAATGNPNVKALVYAAPRLGAWRGSTSRCAAGGLAGADGGARGSASRRPPSCSYTATGSAGPCASSARPPERRRLPVMSAPTAKIAAAHQNAVV